MRLIYANHAQQLCNGRWETHRWNQSIAVVPFLNGRSGRRSLKTNYYLDLLQSLLGLNLFILMDARVAAYIQTYKI